MTPLIASSKTISNGLPSVNQQLFPSHNNTYSVPLLVRMLVIIYLLALFACVSFAHNAKSALVYGSLNSLSSSSQFNQQRSSPSVIIDFYSTWCTPCKVMSPLLEQAASRHQSIMFVKVDVDDFKGLADEFNVTTLPSIVFMKWGRVTEMFTGTKSPEQLTAFINRNKD